MNLTIKQKKRLHIVNEIETNMFNYGKIQLNYCCLYKFSKDKRSHVYGEKRFKRNIQKKRTNRGRM